MEDIRRAASRHHIPKYRCISFYSILFSGGCVVLCIRKENQRIFNLENLSLPLIAISTIFYPFSILYDMLVFPHLKFHFTRKNSKVRKVSPAAGVRHQQCLLLWWEENRSFFFFFETIYLIMNNKYLKKRDGQTDETAATAAAAAAGTFELL